MSCSRTSRCNEAATNVTSNRTADDQISAVPSVTYSDGSGNCNNTYTSGNCASIITPVGLPFDPCKRHERGRECASAGYAYCSSVNAVLGGSAPFPLQSVIESGDGIEAVSDGTVTLGGGIYLVTYSFSGAVSERNKAFIARPYKNGSPMTAESVSVYGTDVGTPVSGSGTFIVKASSDAGLFFKAEGTQMLTGASFTLSIVKIR